MFTAVITFTDKSAKKLEFTDRHRAKSFSGYQFNQENVARVKVYESETKKIMLWLSKKSKKRISIQE